MKNCETCMEKGPDEKFYLSETFYGVKYDLSHDSFVTKNCRECVKEEAKEIYAEIRHGLHSEELFYCAICGAEGGQVTFAPGEMASGMVGFPTFCKECQKQCRTEARKSWSPEQLEKHREYKRKAAEKTREWRRNKRKKLCKSCGAKKPQSEFRRTCSEPFKHSWHKDCKVCELEKIMIELVGST